jgi:hypothetical protein
MFTSTSIGPPVDICGCQANSPGSSGSLPSTVGVGREAFTGLVTAGGGRRGWLGRGGRCSGGRSGRRSAGAARYRRFGVVAKAGTQATAKRRLAQARARVE